MAVEARRVSESQVVMTELVLPSHSNSFGNVFGGVIMSWIDIAAAIAAQRHSGRNVVTASIDSLSFVAPVRVGWVVNLKASVNFVGNTSMEIGVRVEAENPISSQKFHTASAYLTFVALDETGAPVLVAPLIPETVVEKRRFESAKQRKEIRKQTRTLLAR